MIAQLESNVLAQYTRVKVIIPHAGGYIPYQAERIATSGPGGLAEGAQRMAQLKRLYFDTAMSGKASDCCVMRRSNCAVKESAR